MRAETLLTVEGAAAIKAAVQCAERATSGEIVPMVVRRSDRYLDVRLALASLAALAASLAALALGERLTLGAVLAQVGVFGLVLTATSWPSLLRAVVPGPISAARAQRAASLAFINHGLVETRARTGILIFVSLFERRVVVLADRGIDTRVPDGSWDRVVARIVDGVRAERAEEGLAEGIRICGELLSGAVPSRPNDRNELPDEPIV